jgi:hypothetical protein
LVKQTFLKVGNKMGYDQMSENKGVRRVIIYLTDRD